MIRPSSGGFLYNNHEIEVMKQDIHQAKLSGASGVVFGILNKKNEVDVQKNRLLVNIAKSHGLGITFHRAIDVSTRPLT